MELDLADLNPEFQDAGEVREAGLASPMGGKHQRTLSLSAKWASNKALALEYLKRQREVMLWIEGVLNQKLPTHDLYEALKSGIVLRELLLKLYPEPSECLSPISRKYSERMAPWKERENISVFLKQCKALGMNDLFLFCTDDLYEGNNMVQVLFAVQHFMAFSEENSRFWIKPAIHEHITFSNQELELAMSKIEKAGVDANVLLTSAPPSATPSPLKPTIEEDNATSSAAGNEIRDADATSDPCNEVKESVADANTRALEKELQGDCYVIGETGNNDDNSDAERSSHGPEEATPDDGDDGDNEEPIGDVDERAIVQEPSVEDDAAIASEPVEPEPIEKDVADASEARNTPVEGVSVAAMVSEEAMAALETIAAVDPTPAPSNDGIDEVMDDSIDDIVSACMTDMICILVQEEQHSNAKEDDDEEKSVVRAAASTPLLLGESSDKPADTTLENRLESDAHTELLHNSETSTGDSHAATAIDASAAVGGARATTSDDGASTRAARASKRASRASKKQRTQLDEQLEAEAMARCTCGAKCSIM